jgi:general secretion pathway protein D
MPLREFSLLGNYLRFMIPRSFRPLVAAGLVSTLTLSAQTPETATSPQSTATPTPVTTASVAPVDNEPVGLKLSDAPIELALSLLEKWTGRTVLRPQQLPTPTITIDLKTETPKQEAILALETILNLNGIGIIPVGDRFIKVVDLPRVRMEAPQMIEGSTLNLPPSGRVASKLFQLQFQRVTEFLPQINMLLNGNIGGYVVFEKSNAALITDSISTLQRIEMLIQRLDQPLTAGLTPKFYQITSAKASDLVNKINMLVQGPLQGQLGSATKFSADDRTNQIILLADPRQYAFFDELIAKLDVKADPNTRNEVIYLKHAAAKDVATLISQLISGASKESQSVRPGQLPRPPQQPGQPPEPATPPPNIPNQPFIADLGVSTNEFSGLVNIQADERSNAVVISGTVDDIRLVQQLVEKLDIILAQVRIEVVIAEVTLNNKDDTGINSLGLQFAGDKLVGFAARTPGIEAGGSGENAFATITRGEGVSGPRDLSGIIAITAHSTKSNVTILANPTLVTTHNKEASIFVGESRPVFGQIQTLDTLNTGTNGTNPSALRSSITQQEAGINLKIKPLIGNDGTVQLEIEQTFNAFGPDVPLGDDLVQPSINKREAKSFLNVADKEIIVLGGYQSTSRNRSRSRLGPIPIIGDLFGPRSWTHTRTELLVFIRPHVIRGVDNTTGDAQEKLNKSSHSTVIRQALDTDLNDVGKPVTKPERPSLKRPK